MINKFFSAVVAKFKAAPSPHDAAVQAELVKMLYQQTRTILTGLAVTATLVTIIFYNKVPSEHLILWVSVIYGLTFLRALSFRRFKSQQRDPVETIKWGWLFTFFAFLSGCTWGAASILFFTPENMQFFMILTVIIIGLTVASMAAVSAFLWAYYAYATPALLPLAWLHFNIDDPAYAIFGILILILILVLFPFARINHQVLRRSVVLRFENIDLIQQLIKQKEKAEQANIAKTKFLAAASHDLRQPLHAMGLFLGALEERVEKQDQKMIVQKIQKSSSALKDLLDSLLDISKLDAGVIQVNLNSFYIQDLFDSLANEFESDAKEKGLRLKFINSSIEIDSDYMMVERIVRNLLSNAIRYTEDGGIVVGCRRHQGQILLAIYDTGIGIETGQMEEVFQEFHQLHNPERDRSKGLGLGLAIVKRMAELLHAPLLSASIPGKGSMFGLVVPVAAATERAKTVSTISTAPQFFDQPLVLIVDDEIEIRDSLAELLKSWHCRVIGAASANEAIASLVHGDPPYIRPDVILADYRLRDGETGNDVIDKIASLFGQQTIPAIIITGDTAPERIKEANASGYRILHKPVSANELRVLLGEVLSEQQRA